MTNDKQGWDHLETFNQVPPSDTQAVCDLRKNPDDNQQYTLSLD
jgi:branched-chain amino acid transport system substrate-binding protein